MSDSWELLKVPLPGHNCADSACSRARQQRQGGNGNMWPIFMSMIVIKKKPVFNWAQNGNPWQQPVTLPWLKAPGVPSCLPPHLSYVWEDRQLARQHLPFLLTSIIIAVITLIINKVFEFVLHHHTFPHPVRELCFHFQLISSRCCQLCVSVISEITCKICNMLISCLFGWDHII